MVDFGEIDIKEKEIDFGTAVGTFSVTTNVPDNDVTTTSQILAWIAAKVPSDSRDIDEITAEAIEIKCRANAASLDIYAKCFSGTIVGKFIVNYLVS